MCRIADDHHAFVMPGDHPHIRVGRENQLVECGDLCEQRRGLRRQREDLVLPCLQSPGAQRGLVIAPDAPEQRDMRHRIGRRRRQPTNRHHAQHLRGAPVPLPQRALEPEIRVAQDRPPRAPRIDRDLVPDRDLRAQLRESAVRDHGEVEPFENRRGVLADAHMAIALLDHIDRGAQPLMSAACTADHSVSERAPRWIPMPCQPGARSA